MNLLQNCTITKIQDHTASGSSDVVSDILDMAGYEGVVFFTSFGTAAAGNLIKAQGNALNSTVGIADLVGTSVSSGTTDEDVKLDVNKPPFRYVSVTAVRDTASTLESIWAIRYGARTRPVTNSLAGTDIGESHFSPIAGTA